MRIGVFVAVFLINKIAFLFLGVSVLVYFMVESKRIKIKVEKDKNYRKEKEKVTGFIGEIVRGVRDIKMLNAEKSFIKELKRKITGLNDKIFDMQNVNRKYILLRGFVRDLSDLLLILVLVFLIAQKELAIAESFYTDKNSLLTHEISFYYIVKPDDFANISLKDYSKYENDKKEAKQHNFVWLPINSLHDFDFRPTFVKQKLITNNYEFEHIIIK